MMKWRANVTGPDVNADFLCNAVRMTESQFNIRRLRDCPLDNAVSIWNEGFIGYFADMTLTPEAYLARLHNEDISQEFSFIAYSENRPAGFLLNGIRNDVKGGESGEKVVWNGGTGVSPAFRKQGVGKALVQASIELYAQEDVGLATLEAISTNKPAIALYRKFGYEVVDNLIFLRHEGRLDKLAISRNTKQYLAKSVAPAMAGELEFYRHSASWQTQWRSLVKDNGQAVIVYDADGVAAAYALFRRRLGPDKKLESIALYQCEVRPGRADADEILVAALEQVYGPLDEKCRRTTTNLSVSNEPVVKLLREAGFATFVEQVQMTLELSKSSS